MSRIYSNGGRFRGTSTRWFFSPHPGSTGMSPPACVKEATIASEIQRIACR